VDKGCLESATEFVLVNGSLIVEFQSQRDLRQGDLLVPFLFLIVVEGLVLFLFLIVVEGLRGAVREA